MKPIISISYGMRRSSFPRYPDKVVHIPEDLNAARLVYMRIAKGLTFGKPSNLIVTEELMPLMLSHSLHVEPLTPAHDMYESYTIASIQKKNIIAQNALQPLGNGLIPGSYIFKQRLDYFIEQLAQRDLDPFHIGLYVVTGSITVSYDEDPTPSYPINKVVLGEDIEKIQNSNVRSLLMQEEGDVIDGYYIDFPLR